MKTRWMLAIDLREHGNMGGEGEFEVLCAGDDDTARGPDGRSQRERTLVPRSQAVSNLHQSGGKQPYGT